MWRLKLDGETRRRDSGVHLLGPNHSPLTSSRVRSISLIVSFAGDAKAGPAGMPPANTLPIANKNMRRTTPGKHPEDPPGCQEPATPANGG